MSLGEDFCTVSSGEDSYTVSPREDSYILSTVRVLHKRLCPAPSGGCAGDRRLGPEALERCLLCGVGRTEL